MRRTQLVRQAFMLLALLLVLGLAYVGWWCWRLQAGLRQVTEAALEAHPGADRVEALIAIVDSDAFSREERNRAVWALGQIADPRAIPVLEKHYTGEPCDHTQYLCQYELKKAILKCQGDFKGSWQATD